MMTDKILIPLDGTEIAEQVVPFVGEVAKAGGFDVTLLTIVDPSDLDLSEITDEGASFGPEGDRDITGRLQTDAAGSPVGLSKEHEEASVEASRSAREYLAAVERKLRDAGVNAHARLGAGNPDIEIFREAATIGATLIAMSARSEHFWEHGVLGSTTNRVLHASSLPVIVFKPMAGLAHSVTVNPETVVIAVDGSEESERSIAPAAKLAKAIGAEIALVHVLKRDRGRRREHAEAYLEQLSQQLQEMIDGNVETGVVSGKIDDEIILFADEFDRPMIAMAEHGGVSVGRWIRGSTTDKVIRNSGYPVLVIPHSK